MTVIAGRLATRVHERPTAGTVLVGADARDVDCFLLCGDALNGEWTDAVREAHDVGVWIPGCYFLVFPSPLKADDEPASNIAEAVHVSAVLYHDLYQSRASNVLTSDSSKSRKAQEPGEQPDTYAGSCTCLSCEIIKQPLLAPPIISIYHSPTPLHSLHKPPRDNLQPCRSQKDALLHPRSLTR